MVVINSKGKKCAFAVHIAHFFWPFVKKCYDNNYH